MQVKLNKEELELKNSRQEGLVPYEQLQQSDCLVIGVGAVGRQVALQLAGMGVKSLTIYDNDEVALENLAPQAYRFDQLGKNKSEVTADDCHALNSDVKIDSFSRKFARSDHKVTKDKYIFCCVDSITTRKLIWETSCKGEAKWFGDARVAGETLRVLSEYQPKSGGKYEGSLFSQDEAYRGSCTAKMTIYMANLAAGLLVARFAQSLRGMNMYNDHLISILASEISDMEREINNGDD